VTIPDRRSTKALLHFEAYGIVRLRADDSAEIQPMVVRVADVD
jgi:hypothetical protein